MGWSRRDVKRYLLHSDHECHNETLSLSRLLVSHCLLYQAREGGRCNTTTLGICIL